VVDKTSQKKHEPDLPLVLVLWSDCLALPSGVIGVISWHSEDDWSHDTSPLPHPIGS
jgi:hypothetical protein